ncbi:hypothetical protein D6C97_01312 [Aureobasidium pullulans]|nr:hypothetical protein D6C99_03557 [Aureobasidium pullulans]THY66829.1 hypothetical protein D6C97_01312 [Aureobasidium pullulans]
MARRSSARIRAKQSTTPQAQRVSDMGVDSDAIKTPRTAPKLSAVDEHEEPQPTPTRTAQTPRDGTPIQPSMQEMHPQKYQMSTAKPLDEARWLGFSSNKTTQQTPTKTPKAANNIMDNAPDFSFTFQRPTLNLSPQARALMEETRGEAAKIRIEMQATQKGQPSASDVLGRKMATPSGKVSRFSDVHMKAFKKMDSIADHPSAFRNKDNRPLATDKPSAPTAPSALKRSPSKAELERPSSSSSTSLPRPSSRGNLEAGPAKRVKHAAEDDTATSRPDATPKPSLKSAMKSQMTPRSVKPPKSILKSAQSARRTTMIPSFQRSPVRLNMTSASVQQEQAQQQQKEQRAQLLSKSPMKSPVKSTMAERIAQFEPEAPESPLLTRSPAKHASPQKVQIDAPESPDASSKIPFLARSPAKKTFLAAQGPDDKDGFKEKPNKTPLLARSPAKISVPESSIHSAQQETPVKPSLFARFNLLRKSPVKSILRTPQRLYSDDPFKLANGTHMSTPPNATSDADTAAPPRPPKTCPVIKHVDFSASTKTLDQADESPDTPTKASSPPSTTDEKSSITYPTLPNTSDKDDRPKKAYRRMTMAGAPNDFTFRAGAQAITFAPSPRRTTSQEVKPSIRSVEHSPELPSAAGQKRKADTHDLKATATTTSDKENDDDADHRPAKKARSDNPAPSRPSTTTPAAAKTPVKKIPTIGVRPKSYTSKPKEKRPGMLSAARLAALATPKRR